MSPRRRRRILIGLGVLAVALAGAAAGVFALTREGDVTNPDVEFRAEPTPTAVPELPEEEPDRGRRRGRDPLDDFVWAHYGYSKDRRRYLPAPTSTRPPFYRLWSFRGSVLLEFPPVIGKRSLFLVRNSGGVYALSKKTGKILWKKSLGALAASSPAYGDGRVYVTILQRERRTKAGRIVALRASDGKMLWSRPLASRTESSPLLDGGRVYFGSENGTVYAMNARTGAVRWRFKAAGAVKSGLALADGKLYFGDYAGRMYALRKEDGSRAWVSSPGGGALGLRAGQFYSTPAVAFGRVYIGNTNGRVYSFSSRDGKLAWSRRTGDYVYGSPAVAQLPGSTPMVWVGSYDGTFYAFDARSGETRWKYRSGGKISGGATVIGDIVYFSDLGKKTTYGLGARTGNEVFRIRRGAFNPVVSDGRTIFLTGYSQLYAMRPILDPKKRARALGRR